MRQVPMMHSLHRAQTLAAFQRPLAVSLGIHILICGTALAFAHYGEALFTGGPRIITVDLVGEGGRSAPGPGPVRTAKRMTAAEPVIPALSDAGAQAYAPPAAGPDEDAGTGQAATGAGVPNDSSLGGNAGVGSNASVGHEGALSSEQWRLLQTALDKAKTYPRFARERGIEGMVLVRFKVLPTGEIDGVRVVRSSGATVLDDASIKTVYRAAPMPYVKGWVEVPMVYELK